MTKTIAIVFVVLVVAAVIIVRRKIRSGEPESESESEVPEESDVPMESDIPKNVRRLMERARSVKQKYWTPNSDEKKRMLMKGTDELAWDEVLRLLHLTCLEMFSDGLCREQLVNERIQLEQPLDAPLGDAGYWGRTTVTECNYGDKD